MAMTVTQLIKKGFKTQQREIGVRGKYSGKAFYIDQVSVIIYNYTRKKKRLTVTDVVRYVSTIYLSYNSHNPSGRRKTPSRNMVAARMEQLYSIEKLEREKEIKSDGYKRWVYYDPEVEPSIATYNRGTSISLNLFDMGLLGVEALGAPEHVISFIRDSKSSLPFPSDFYDILDMLIDRASGMKDFDMEGLEKTMRKFANLINVEIK